jgi:hypothetical protein
MPITKPTSEMTKTTNAPNAGDAAGMVEAARDYLHELRVDDLGYAELMASFAAERTAALQRENAALIEQRDAYKEACVGYEAVIAEGREDWFAESAKKVTNGVIDHLVTENRKIRAALEHYADDHNWDRPRPGIKKIRYMAGYDGYDIARAALTDATRAAVEAARDAVFRETVPLAVEMEKDGEKPMSVLRLHNDRAFDAGVKFATAALEAENAALKREKADAERRFDQLASHHNERCTCMVIF